MLNNAIIDASGCSSPLYYIIIGSTVTTAAVEQDSQSGDAIGFEMFSFLFFFVPSRDKRNNNY